MWANMQGRIGLPCYWHAPWNWWHSTYFMSGLLIDRKTNVSCLWKSWRKWFFSSCKCLSYIFFFDLFNCQVVPLTAAVIVTTPQKLAFIDVAKGVRMFSKLKVQVPCVAVLSAMFFSLSLWLECKFSLSSWKDELLFFIVHFTLECTGSLRCRSWEHVPLRCWWKTLLPLRQGFRVSGLPLLLGPIDVFFSFLKV